MISGTLPRRACPQASGAGTQGLWHLDSWPAPTQPATAPRSSTQLVCETGGIFEPFIRSKCGLFTKTGSGQTSGKLKKGCYRFPRWRDQCAERVRRGPDERRRFRNCRGARNAFYMSCLFCFKTIVVPRQARDKYLRETHKKRSFLEFSLCLSRACLGKIIISIYKWRKKPVFSPLRRCGRSSSGCICMR